MYDYLVTNVIDMSSFSKLFSQEDVVVETSESVPVEPMPTNEQSVWGVIARWGVYLVAFLTPLWFLPLTVNPVDGNKLFLISILTIVGFIAWLGMAVYTGVLHIPRFAPFYALGVWLVTYFLAALFSVSSETSFWGSSPASFFYLLIGGVLAFLVAVTLRATTETRRVHALVLAAAAVAALFMLIQTLFGIDIFPWEFAKQRTFHLIGQWNVIGIFFGFILVSLLPFFTDRNDLSKSFRVFVIALSILSLILTVVVNYRVVWIGIALVSIIYLAYHYSRPVDRTMRMRQIAWPLFLLLASVLFYLSQDMVSALTQFLNPPLDVTPSLSSSFQIAEETLRERPVLGVGPNLFGYAWDRFKDPAVNTTIFWRLRFGTASSFATTLLTTTGILGALGFLLFIGSILWSGFALLNKLRWEEPDHRHIGATFFGLLFLLISWFLYPLTVVVSVFTFLTLGLLAAEVRGAGLIEFPAVSIRADSAKGFVTALVIIFLMVFGVVGLYITSQKQVAAVLYGWGVETFDRDGAINGAENLFRRAVRFDSSRDQYYRAITQTSSIKLQRSLENSASQPAEDVRSAFQTALSSAITSAQAATQVNPGDSINWRLLGQVYESVIPFVGGSADAAVEAYQHAIAQSPHDPMLRDDLARIYIAQGDYVKAREALEEAIRLKPDFAAAHFRLAQIAAIKGNVNDAIANSERAAIAAPNDIGILFQLGLLYYQQSRNREAQQILERAVELNPNYSNARYFLGLVYAARGERALAVEQFERIRDLNADNAEVRAILENLNVGKDPLSGISPPPLNRGQVPVKKEGEELEQTDVLQESPTAGDTAAEPAE